MALGGSWARATPDSVLFLQLPRASTILSRYKVFILKVPENRRVDPDVLPEERGHPWAVASPLKEKAARLGVVSSGTVTSWTGLWGSRAPLSHPECQFPRVAHCLHSAEGTDVDVDQTKQF